MSQHIWTKTIIYYSPNDETAFFSWLQSIKGVKKVEGRGTQLIIHLRSKRLSDAALRDFLAIYKRYQGDMRELAPFLTPKNEPWFKNPQCYWYKSVFGPAKRKQKPAAKI